MHRFRMSTRRRVVGVITAAFAALAMVAQPALAANGHISAQRPFTISGARNHLAQNIRVNDSAMGATAGTNFLIGGAETGTRFGIGLTQMGAGKVSRKLNLDGWGRFKNVASPNNTCVFESMSDDGGGLLLCDYNGFDWATGTTYRIVATRGDVLAKPIAKNSNGYYWLLQIYTYNAKTKKWTGQKIVSFRLPHGLIGAAQDGPYIFTNPDNCDAIDRVSATFAKPVGKGSTTAWQKVAKYVYGCSDPTLGITNHKNGAVTLVIAT